jgi:hypothetical protein
MSKFKIRIPNSGLLKGSHQVRHLMAAQYDGLIQNLRIKQSRKNSNFQLFTFMLCESEFILPNGDRIKINYESYRIRIEYGAYNKPRVFIDSHNIERDCGHLNADNTLCLYKTTDFIWKNTNSIAKDIVPLIYAWIYFYEDWINTKIWYGFSAKH